MTQACRECGCTNLSACPGGCWWVEDDLCSSCPRAPGPAATDIPADAPSTERPLRSYRDGQAVESTNTSSGNPSQPTRMPDLAGWAPGEITESYGS